MVSKDFARLQTAHRLRKVRFHDLRHSAATVLLSAGVHPKVVSERLGHASVAITLDVYSHILPDVQEAAALAMDWVLSSGKERAF